MIRLLISWNTLFNNALRVGDARLLLRVYVEERMIQLNRKCDRFKALAICSTILALNLSAILIGVNVCGYFSSSQSLILFGIDVATCCGLIVCYDRKRQAGDEAERLSRLISRCAH